MIEFPTYGFSRSTNQHNVDLGVFCDWIESSVLFDDEELSMTDIVDALMEENIYADANMAQQMVSNAWSEIRRRHSWIGGANPFLVHGPRITRSRAWEAVCAHSFCLLLSLSQYRIRWTKAFKGGYGEQGELFEDLTKESLSLQFNGWQVLRTGWGATNCAYLADTVKEVARALGENLGNVVRWTADNAKDAELDLVCYRPFLDHRVGVPVFLVQCASGANWTEKLHTPRLEIWTKVIDFAARPRKAFALPLALDDSAFIRNCNLVDGLLLDRYRILAASTLKEDWMSRELRTRLVSWSTPRIKALPFRR